MHLVAWAQLKGRNSFRRLLPSDLAALPDEASGGVSVFLRYRERLSGYLRSATAAGRPLPSFQGQNGAFLNLHRVFAQAGVGDGAAMSCGDLLWAAGTEQGLLVGKRKFEPIPRDRTVTWSTLHQAILPLERLWEMRAHIEIDAPEFPPFPDGAASVAARIGKPVGRTPTPPTLQYFKLLEHSLTWVVEYAPTLLEDLELQHSDKPRKDLSRPAAPGAPWPYGTRRTAATRPSLERAITALMAACYVVIVAFTARRKVEVMRLMRDCIKGSPSEGLWIRSYIAKTLREDDQTPCPNCVSVAVQVLERLAPAEQLFRWRNPYGQSVGLEIDTALDRFVSLLDLPRTDDGTAWNFNSHQLRRMFAVLYVWRWHYGDIESLSHHLRHFNLEMTRIYATTPELGGMIAEEEGSYAVTIIQQVASGSRSVGGRAGTRMKQLIARLGRTLEVHTPDRMAALIERFTKRAQLVIKTNPWSYCLCPNTRQAGEQAHCRQLGSNRQGDGADLSAARPEVCHGCPFNMTDPTFAPFLERELQRLRAEQRAGMPELLLNAHSERIAALEDYLENDVLAARPMS